MNLSKIVRSDRKSVYPETYKHLIDVIKRAPFMILDNSTGNAMATDDHPITFRFNFGDGRVETFEFPPSALYNLVRGQVINADAYKYELKGVEPTFDTVEVD